VSSLASLEGYRKFVLLRDVRPRTRYNYEYQIRRLAEHYDQDPAELSEAQVRDYFVYLRKDRSYGVSSMKCARASLRHFFEGFLKIEPRWTVFDQLVIRKRLRIPTVLSREDVDRLLRAVDEPRFHMVLLLIYHCGLRLSEALAIEVKDIDAKTQRLHVREGKGGKERYVPISMIMIKALRVWWCTHKNPHFLFPSAGSAAAWKGPDRAKRLSLAMYHATRPICQGSVQLAVRFGVARCGFKNKVTPHTLRHCYATHLLEAGVNLRYISLYLGHASLNETLIYTHLTATSKQHTQEVITGLLKGLQLEISPTDRAAETQSI
jgi:integrase/recombinase XerD